MPRSPERAATWVAVALCLCAFSAQAAKLPALDEVPDQLPQPVRLELGQQKTALTSELATFTAEAKAFNARATQPDDEFNALEARRKKYVEDAEAFNERVDAATSEHVVRSLNALAKKQKWTTKERARLEKALAALEADGGPSNTAQRVQAWKDVLARDGAAFSKEAAEGSGPLFPAAGTQSFEDCALYAVANAAGVLYEVVAARATRLIEEGEHRPAAQRASAQKTIEDEGLMGGEVIMLAEAMGEVEVVPSTAFPLTLKGGRPIMINVISTDGGLRSAHEVVLTRTFRHDGEVWFEMIDSNQDEWRRLYWSARELDLILKENGVAFRRDAHSTPQLLRKSEHP